MDPRKDTWSETDKLKWLSKQQFQRSYSEQVLARIEQLRLKKFNGNVKIESYGNLSLQGRDELAIDGAILSPEEYESRYPLRFVPIDSKPVAQAPRVRSN